MPKKGSVLPLVLLFLVLVAVFVVVYFVNRANSKNGQFASTTLVEAQETNSDPPNIYAMAEVRTHNSRKDCWIVTNNKIYDVTSLESNPQNDKILSVCGADATKQIENNKDLKMSELNKFYVGNIGVISIPK